MKKLSIIFSSFFILAISACKKESSGDNVLQGSFVPAYVDFTTANLTIDPPTKDTAISLTFSIRTAYQQKVTATYSVTGAVTLTNQTAVIDRNTTSVAVNLPIPGGATGSLVVSLTKATLADGTVLRLGVQGAVNTPRTRTIKIGG